MNYKLFIICLLLTLASCKKRQYCLYRRLDLRYEYVLKHNSRPTFAFSLIYDYSDPYNVKWTEKNKKEFDSLLNLEHYEIDTLYSRDGFGYTYYLDGNCQYCDYYKSLYPYIICEPREE